MDHQLSFGRSAPAATWVLLRTVNILPKDMEKCYNIRWKDDRVV